jgi:hypothetical protein
MISARWIIVVWFGILPINATAALVQLAGTNASTPFTISTANEPVEPLSLLMQIDNNSDDAINIAIWQLDLDLRGLSESIGRLVFTEVKAPPDGLFEPVPGPLGSLMDPSEHILVFDGDLVNPDGRSIPPHTARNIVELFLRADPGTRGEFQLIMNLLDPLSPTNGSSYLKAGEPLPTPFGNSTHANGDGILLGSIIVSSIPEPCTDLHLLIGILVGALWGRARRSLKRPRL